MFAQEQMKQYLQRTDYHDSLEYYQGGTNNDSCISY